jgi:hypothetical protein
MRLEVHLWLINVPTRLIFCLLIPFTEVILHTIIDQLRQQVSIIEGHNLKPLDFLIQLSKSTFSVHLRPALTWVPF